MKSAQYQHVFLGTTKQGKVAIFKTSGNDDTHIILRGGKQPNYEAEDIQKCLEELKKSEVNQCIMIDFSHGNSQKIPGNQKKVSQSVCKQIETGNKNIVGVMIESNIEEGNQKLSDNMEYGKSITDACLGWEDTEILLNDLSSSVEKRRNIG